MLTRPPIPHAPSLSASLRALLKPYGVAVSLMKPGVFASPLLEECMASSGVSRRLVRTLTPASVAASIAAACDAGKKEFAFNAGGSFASNGLTQRLINLCPLWLARKLRTWKLDSERETASKAAAEAAAPASEPAPPMQVAEPAEEAPGSI